MKAQQTKAELAALANATALDRERDDLRRQIDRAKHAGRYNSPGIIALRRRHRELTVSSVIALARTGTARLPDDARRRLAVQLLEPDAAAAS